MARPSVDGGIAVYADGEQVTATSEGAGWRDLAGEIVSSDEAAFVPLVDPGQNTTRVALVAAAPNAENVRLVGVVTLDTLAATNALKSLHASESVHLQLVDADGLALYHSDPAQVGQANDDMIAPLEPGQAVSATERRDARGNDVIAVSAAVPAAGWTLVQEERWKETLSPLMRYSQAAPLALVPGLLIALGAVWLGIQRIVYPLRRLEAQATDLA